MRQGKETEHEKDVEREPDQEPRKPKLQDLDADLAKADEVRAGEGHCYDPWGC